MNSYTRGKKEVFRKLLTIIVLSLVMITGAFAQDVDQRVIQINGQAWSTLEGGAKEFMAAGWLMGHTGLSIMMHGTERLRGYDTDEEWLLFDVTVEQLVLRVDMWYSRTEAYAMPVFVVMYIVSDKLLWSEDDWNRLFEIEPEKVPGLS